MLSISFVCPSTGEEIKIKYKLNKNFVDYNQSLKTKDADETLSLITPKTKLLIINTPSNPTGGIVSTTEMNKLSNGLINFPHVTILSDEIYSRILYSKNDHISVLNFDHLRDRVIVLDGFSKTYAMTGWRIGYGIWLKSLIQIATRLSINYHSCVSSASQFGGIAALKGPQDPVTEMISEFKKRRYLMVDGLNQIPGFNCPTPKGAFYAFPNIHKTEFKALELQKKYLEKVGVAIISGTSFGNLGEGYLCFSYANSQEQLTKAIERLKNCL